MTHNQHVYLLGDSHIGPIFNFRSQNADEFHRMFEGRAKLSSIDNGMIAYSFSSRTNGRAVVLNPIVLMAFEQQGIYSRYTNEWDKLDCPLVFLTGFVESHILGLDWRWQGYSFGGERLPGATTLPDSLIRETIESRMEPYFAGMELIKKQGYRVCQVVGPPPHREVAARVVGMPFTLPPKLRVTLFEIVSTTVSDRMKSMGIELIETRFLADEATGLIKDEFANDGVHTNEKGGAAVLGAIERHLSGAAVEHSP